MQKTLEILKNEDGLIIKRLSHKKLLFIYTVPIFLGDFTDVVVGYLPLKVRYLINNEDTNYKCCDINKLYCVCSNRWGIKLKHVGTNAKREVVNIDGKGISFDRVIKSFYFTDPVWIRDYKLKNILDETR